MTAVEKIATETAPAALIAVDSAPAKISVNFEEVKASLAAELEKYNIVVTADTVADAKKLATELNKNATEFGKLRRDAVAKVSGPIKLFEGQMKELESMCKDGRASILQQVEKFEAETREKARAMLAEKRLALWEAQGVEPEFRSASFDDLVKVTALTKKGNLTAAAVNEITARVQADKALQAQTETRLLKLENESYRAGLSAPLTRAHVEAFLFLPEEEYRTRLEAMLDSEKERQEIAEQKARIAMRDKQEAIEKQEAELAAKREEFRRQQAEQEAKRAATAEVGERPDDSHPGEPIAGFAPLPDQLPDPMPLPEAAAVTEQHAVGPIADPRASQRMTCTRADAEQMAATISQERMGETVGVWIRSGLVSVALWGDVFRKV